MGALGFARAEARVPRMHGTTGTYDRAFERFFRMDRVDPCSAEAHIENWIVSIQTRVSSAVRHVGSTQPVEPFRSTVHANGTRATP
jgi:hypothetical protein